VSQPVNPESISMQTTTPELMPELQAPLKCYEQARACFEAARDEADRLDAEIQLQRKAAEEAEREAKQAREEVAQLLRKRGTSAKDIQPLKAKERAAYTLAEDYRSVMAELEAAYEEACYQVSSAKSEEDGRYAAVLEAYADALMKRAKSALDPLYGAIRVQEWANSARAAHGTATWKYWGESARSAALSVMYDHMKRGFDSFKFDVKGDAVLQAAQRPAGLDRFKEISPAARHLRRVTKQLAAARQQQSINQ